MKILVFGATGMLGHKLIQILSKKHTIIGTVRGQASELSSHPVLSGYSIIGNVDADNQSEIKDVIEKIHPDIIINCIGIVKQLPAAQDPLQSIAVNALFPHQLAKICRDRKIRLIHISTDCVFSGSRGHYSEIDTSDAEDLYGKTKYLGEVTYPGCLTIRTSIIGRELNAGHGLIDWFLNQEGKTIFGYKRAIFSGLTTIALSEIIGQIISDYPDIDGLIQIASKPISKYDLLCLVKRVYRANITIEPDETIINDRSLNPRKFTELTDIQIPAWEEMIEAMVRDPTPYTLIKGILPY